MAPSFLLQLGALSMLYGHQLGGLDRLIVIAVMVFMVVVNGVQARKVLRTFALPPGEQWVSGSYVVDTDRHGKGGAPQSSMFADGGLWRLRCSITLLPLEMTRIPLGSDFTSPGAGGRRRARRTW